MTRLFLPVFLLLAISLPACQPASPPAPPAAPAPARPRIVVEAPPGSTETAGEAGDGPAERSRERRFGAARSEILGRTDGGRKTVGQRSGSAYPGRRSGNVILIDTAANRSWVDDYQMQQLLVFPTLQTLTVEGPSITEQLAPKIAEAGTYVAGHAQHADRRSGDRAVERSEGIADHRSSPLRAADRCGDGHVGGDARIAGGAVEWRQRDRRRGGQVVAACRT
jgi:hypothetical protein